MLLLQTDALLLHFILFTVLLLLLLLSTLVAEQLLLKQLLMLRLEKLTTRLTAASAATSVAVTVRVPAAASAETEVETEVVAEAEDDFYAFSEPTEIGEVNDEIATEEPTEAVDIIAVEDHEEAISLEPTLHQPKTRLKPQKIMLIPMVVRQQILLPSLIQTNILRQLHKS